MDSLAETVLNTIRSSLRLNIGCVRVFDHALGDLVWQLNARSADGVETWTATAEDKYEAACALAELVGFDLMDG